jgi:hypothetical protein
MRGASDQGDARGHDEVGVTPGRLRRATGPFSRKDIRNARVTGLFLDESPDRSIRIAPHGLTDSSAPECWFSL